MKAKERMKLIVRSGEKIRWSYRMKYLNVHGDPADENTEPPDLHQCGAFPNMLNWSFMSLGPRPKPIRCENKPVCVVVENKKDDDGRIGSMSLCLSCLDKFRSKFAADFAHVTQIET